MPPDLGRIVVRAYRRCIAVRIGYYVLDQGHFFSSSGYTPLDLCFGTKEFVFAVPPNVAHANSCQAGLHQDMPRALYKEAICGMCRVFRDQLRPMPVKRLLLQPSTSNYWSCSADPASLLLQEQRGQHILPQQPCSHWYSFAPSLFMCLIFLILPTHHYLVHNVPFNLSIEGYLLMHACIAWHLQDGRHACT